MKLIIGIVMMALVAQQFSAIGLGILHRRPKKHCKLAALGGLKIDNSGTTSILKGKNVSLNSHLDRETMNMNKGHTTISSDKIHRKQIINAEALTKLDTTGNTSATMGLPAVLEAQHGHGHGHVHGYGHGYGHGHNGHGYGYGHNGPWGCSGRFGGYHNEPHHFYNGHGGRQFYGNHHISRKWKRESSNESHLNKHDEHHSYSKGHGHGYGYGHGHGQWENRIFKKSSLKKINKSQSHEHHRKSSWNDEDHHHHHHPHHSQHRHYIGAAISKL